MSIGQTLIGILVLATSACVFAQTAEPKPPPDVGDRAAKAVEGVEILTDTMGVDFGPYLKGIVPTVRHNWDEIVLSSVSPSMYKRGKVSIEFDILKDGTVGGMKVHASSGDATLDRTAWGSITASDPFPSLPKEFPGERIGLRFYYYYNLKAGDSLGSNQPLNICHFDTISISPCVDVQVPAGSTLKFVALGKDITDTSVRWSIPSPGCSKSACGTISDAGIYTAPSDVPNPPKIIVQATSQADMSVTAKSEVTIGQVNPPHFVLAAHGQTQPPDNTDTGNTAPSSVLKVGNGVTPPRATYRPNPEYSEDARAAGYQGTCVLWLVVGPDGKPRDIGVARKLGLGLDEKAIEAVKNWRFEPALKDGKPVAVQVNVEVSFQLYSKENARISKLRRKADAGDPKAELELSRAYFDGRDVPKNDVEGLRLLERAANGRSAQAQFLMGEHAYAHGSSSADYVSAYMWYELARRGGYKHSDEMLKEVASKISPEQLTDAKTRVDNWPNSPAK